MQYFTNQISRNVIRAWVFILCLMLAPTENAGGSIPSTGLHKEFTATAAWESDLDEAIGKSRISLKPILIFFTSPECLECIRIKQFLLDHEAIQPILKSFERVEIDLSRRPELAMIFQVKMIPSFYVIEPDGRINGVIEGYVNVMAFQTSLERLLSNDMQLIDSDDVMPPIVSGHATKSQWRKALRAMKDSKIRLQMRPVSAHLTSEDLINLSSCLSDWSLAVRLGAIELLEGVNDRISGYDPWQNPYSEAQKIIIKRWRAWAATGEIIREKDTPLTQADFDRCIRNLISNEPERVRKAMQTLEKGGEYTSRLIIDYLKKNPEIDENALRLIKEIQYTLVIPLTRELNPRTTAHQIIWGNQDVQIRTIRQLGDCDLEASAILVDLLNHKDPLIREAAVETIFKTSGQLAVSPIKNLLEREKDPEIIFIALKNLGDTESYQSKRILESYFNHENEDLVIAAIEGAVKLSVRSLGTKMLPLLKDPRWRVRVAAIEAIKEKGGYESNVLDKMRGKERKLRSDVSIALLGCLDDPDEFVRHTAAVALGHLKIDKAEESLKQAYDKHPEMHGVIVSVLIELGKSIPATYVEDLFGPDTGDLLYVLDRMEEIKGKGREIVHRAALSENLDIACSALRIIAASEEKSASDNNLLTSALKSGSPEKQLTVIQEFDLNSERTKKAKNAFQKNDPSSKSVDPASPFTDTDVLFTVAALMKDSSTTDLVKTEAIALLCQYGHREAFLNAEKKWPELSTSQKKVVASSLPLFGKDAIPLFKMALDDDNNDVWDAALDWTSGFEGPFTLLPALQDYLLCPASRLTPSMLWPSGLYWLCSDKPEKLIPFAKIVLNDTDSFNSDVLILALTALACKGSTNDEQQKIIALTKNENPFVRRAAWLALISSDKDNIIKYYDPMTSDSSRFVRELVPEVLYNSAYGRTSISLYFSQEESFTGYRGIRLNFPQKISADFDENYGYEPRPQQNESSINLLKKMINAETNQLLRFRCMISLLSFREPLDLVDVYETAKATGNPAKVAYILGDFFSDNYRSLGENFKYLLPLLKNSEGGYHNAYIIEDFIERWDVDNNAQGERGVSFVSAKGDNSDKVLLASFTDGESHARPDYKPLQTVLFTSKKCRQCLKTKIYLMISRLGNPTLRIDQHDIFTREGLLFNEALGQKFLIEDEHFAAVPAIFMPGGYLVNNEINAFSLEELATLSSNADNDEFLLSVNGEELKAADETIKEHRKAYSWTTILKNAFYRGINPFAVTSLLFILFYLFKSGRPGKIILKYGLLYVVVSAFLTSIVWLIPERFGFIEMNEYLDIVGNAMTWLMLFWLLIVSLKFLAASAGSLLKNTTKQRNDKKKPSGRIFSRKGLLFLILPASLLLILWLLPLNRALISNMYIVYIVRGILIYLIVIWLVIVLLRFFFIKLTSWVRKSANRSPGMKNKKSPGIPHVLLMVILWAIVAAVLEMSAMGSGQIATLVFCIKNQFMVFPSVVMLLSACLVFMLPSVFIVLMSSGLRANDFCTIFAIKHRFVFNAILTVLWLWVTFQYICKI